MDKRLKSPKIEPHEMVALWNYDDDGRITELVIVSEHDFTPELHAKYDSWWGKGERDWGLRGFRNKPAGLFAYLATARGFVSKEVARTVLIQFSRVRGQQWSKRTMDWLDELK